MVVSAADMPERPGTFSENWHVVAEQRIALRLSVHTRRQRFRGEMWHVVEDPFTNQFYRLRPSAYDFIARLRTDRTVEEAWREALDTAPDAAPGQEEVLQLLAQLHHANLLQSSAAGDSAQLFERYKKRRQKETKSKLTSIMFARFPLLDPDAFLRRTLPFVRPLFTLAAALVWLGVVGWAVKILVENFDSLRAGAGSVLAPSNLPLLYAGLIFLKVIHEFGHGYACRRFSGEVHVMGVMLLIFTPMPFVDASSSWAFRSRWQRILVAAAGMLAELFIAALAVFVWAGTSSGALHSLAYNMIFVASVSTLLFNANPLLRYDGYYILSDLLQIPNLYTRATRMARHLAEHYGFGMRKSHTPARDRREAVFLAIYFVASAVYRVVLFAGIILFVADRYLIIGLIMALVCGIAWVAKPTIGLVNYLAFEPRLERTRGRAKLVTIGTLAAILLVLWFVPFPNRFRAPGVLQAEEHSEVFAEAPGYLEKIHVQPGATVAKGAPLLELANVELALQLADARAQESEAEARRNQAMERGAPELRSIASRLAAIRKRLAYLESQREKLVVRAPQAGVWHSPDLDLRRGTWLARGEQLGELVDESAYRFSAVISQRDVAYLFDQHQRRAEVRITGQADATLPVTREQILPANQEMLPSAALGFRAGGDVAVAQNDRSGRRAAEPFFEVRAAVANPAGATLRHGLSGQIRFDLEPEPLLQQWTRKISQLFQSKFQ